jgi:1-deoxy-D-xylulose-5-phosphate synthase
MQTLFEDLGWNYIGVADGSRIDFLEDVLVEAKNSKKPCIVHIHTTKGKGYTFAEENPGAYHGVSSFELEVGVSQGSKSFSSVFGESICAIAEKNQNICAITAAMSSGTGLDSFAKNYPDRFFDVGIAEEHALTFSAALATEGFIPYFAVYSTFAQRCYDQIIHDAALQDLHIVLCLDRAGFSAPDGATHHGLFDVSFLCGVPKLTLYAPESFKELNDALIACENEKGVCAVRYPKGSECGFPDDASEHDGYKYKDFGKENKTSPDCVVITYGKCAANASKAAERLEGIFVRVICVTKLKPFSVESLSKLIGDAKFIYLPEEGIRQGGFAMQITAEIKEKELFGGAKIKINAIDDKFVPHGTPTELYKLCGLDPDTMEKHIRDGIAS